MKNYLKQVEKECNRKHCLNVFCRAVSNKSEAKAISKILDQYGEIFICSNLRMDQNKSRSRRKGQRFNFNSVFDAEFIDKIELNRCPLVDLYFYVMKLLHVGKGSNSSIPTKETSNNCFNFNKITKSLDIEFNDVFSEDLDTIEVLSRKAYTDFNHEYCKIVQNDLSSTDSYILSGVIELLLLRFHNEPDYSLSTIIIKMFTFLIEGVNYCSIDESYFCLLDEVLNYTLNLINDSKMKIVERCENFCLFSFNLSNSDFERMVVNLKHIIEINYLTDVRIDSELLFYFELYKKTYLINLSQKIVDENLFLLEDFFGKINIKQEIKFSRLNFSTCLNYDFSIPLYTKSAILKSYNTDLMRNSLQDAFFRALFEGVSEPYLYISIRRDHVFQDTFNFFSKYAKDLNTDCNINNDLKKQLKVRFIGEEGIDSGGIKKEYFLLLSHEIENDTKNFIYLNNRQWFKKGVDLIILNVIGRIIAISLYNDVVLNIPFPSLLFKKLLGIPLDFHDLEEIEPEIYNSLSNLKMSTQEELAFVDQNFTVEIRVDDGLKCFELIDNGAEIKVDRENVHDFANLYSLFLTEKLIEEEFTAFRNGFFSVINQEGLQYLKYKELESIIMGTDDYDFECLMENTSYNGYKIDDNIIVWFWEIFFELSLFRKKKLIQFIIGNDRMPIGGPKSLNLVILKNGCDTDRLPSSQTCFNTLLLPEYTSKNKLESKLKSAIEMTAGFYLL